MQGEPLHLGGLWFHARKSAKIFRNIDPVLGSVVDKIGDINFRNRPASFEEFIRIIVNQKLSNRAANTIV